MIKDYAQPAAEQSKSQHYKRIKVAILFTTLSVIVSGIIYHIQPHKTAKKKAPLATTTLVNTSKREAHHNNSITLDFYRLLPNMNRSHQEK